MIILNNRMYEATRRYSGGGGNSAAQLAETQRQEREKALREGTRSIDTAFGGFNPAFYERRKQAYIDYAMPQLGSQFRQTQQGTSNRLFSQGLQDSSQARSLGRSLLTQLGQNQQTIANQAQAQANQLQQNIEGQRLNLYNQLSASQNPSMAATAALSSAQAYQTPSAFVPIGQLFSDWTANYLGSMNNRTYNNAIDSLNRTPSLSIAPLPK